MCVGDLQLGRKIRTSQRIVAVTTTSGVLVTFNPQRVGLRLGAPDSDRVTVSLEETAVFGQGFVLSEGDKPCFFSLYQDGDMPGRAFMVIADFGTPNITIWESILTEELLRG